MRDFVIVTDSSCDLPVEIIDKYDIRVAPMGLFFDSKAYKHYHDFRELSANDFYNGMRSGAIGSTAGTNIQDAIDVMRPILDESKDIIYLSISSGLSCSYQNACLAADEMREEYPDAHIEVVDTKSVTLGVGIMAYVAAAARQHGDTMETVVEYLKSTCENVSHYFTVDDLAHLQRSGRISHLTSILGSVLGIKPIFAIGADGKVRNESKARGRKAGIKYIVDKSIEKCSDPSIFGICHADSPDDAAAIQERIKKVHPDAEFLISNIGPIIGVNTGVGTLAVVCIGKER